MKYVQTTSELLSHILQAQVVAAHSISTSSSDASPPPSPPPPDGTLDYGVPLTGAPPVLELMLAPGTYSLAGLPVHPERTSNDCLTGCSPPLFLSAHVPILVNGFTLRLTSFGEGAVIDANHQSRHFQLMVGDFSYATASGAGSGSGSSQIVMAAVGGTLVLNNVHLANGRADIVQVGHGGGLSTMLTAEHASIGGGCVLVQHGSLEMRSSRLTGCSARNTNANTLPGGSTWWNTQTVPTYNAPRGGAIDVMRGSVTLVDVRISQATLDESGRAELDPPNSGSRGGLINMRSGTSLSLQRAVLACRGGVGLSTQPMHAELDATRGGAIAGVGATIDIRDSTITGCRTYEGGAVYIEGETSTAGTLTVMGSALADHSALCTYAVDPFVAGTCGGGGHGGCVMASKASVTISGSSLDLCRVTQGHGGAIHALASSTVQLVSSNVTNAYATAREGLFVGMFGSNEVGVGAVASLRASIIDLQSVLLSNNRAETGAHLFSFLSGTQASLGTGRRLQSASVGQSVLKASGLTLAHTCASTSPNEASLVAEGNRAVATTSNYRVVAMRGLQASVSGPCDSTALTSSLRQMVAPSGSEPGVCANATQSCQGAIFINTDGTTAPVCATAATCTCVTVALAMPPTINAAALPATPECSCAAGTSVADVPDMAGELVPYDAPAIGCETHATITSFLYTAESAVVNLNKLAAAESTNLNVSLTIGGSATRNMITWSVVPNASTASAMVQLTPWLAAIEAAGQVSKSSSAAITISVPLRIDSASMREDVAPYQYALKVSVGLRNNEDATIPVNLFVAAQPVAAQCTVQLPSGQTASEALLNVSSVLRVPFTFLFTSRDCDGLELNHREVGFTVNVRRNGIPAPSTTASYVIEYTSGGTYRVAVTPTLLGAYELRLARDGESFNASQTIALQVGCAGGMEPIDGGLCGCATGSQPSADGRCELCPRSSYKPLAGDFPCTACFDMDAAVWPGRLGKRARGECHCPVRHFRMHNTSSVPDSPEWGDSLQCVPCPTAATCAVGATLETIDLRAGHWRFGSRSQDIRTCDRVGNESNGGWSPCRGGDDAGELGDGHCMPGHQGPLCQVCSNSSHYYRGDRAMCVECLTTSDTIRNMLLFIGVVALVLAFWCLLRLTCYRWILQASARLHSKVQAMSLMPKFKVTSRVGTGVVHVAVLTVGHSILAALSSCLRFINRSQCCPPCTMFASHQSTTSGTRSLRSPNLWAGKLSSSTEGVRHTLLAQAELHGCI